MCFLHHAGATHRRLRCHTCRLVPNHILVFIQTSALTCQCASRRRPPQVSLWVCQCCLWHAVSQYLYINCGRVDAAWWIALTWFRCTLHISSKLRLKLHTMHIAACRDRRPAMGPRHCPGCTSYVLTPHPSKVLEHSRYCMLERLLPIGGHSHR